MIFKRIVKCIKCPQKIVCHLNSFKIGHIFTDKFVLKNFYRVRLGKKLNLKNPQTFNEKLQWLKLYNRKPEYTMMVDKYEAKKYVANIIGEEYIIPTYGVWDRFEDIDFDALPDQFVLKCTHDCGGLVICRDKSKLDINKAKNKIEKCLKKNYYWSSREWPYKNVKPRIIAEKYMGNGFANGLIDYKFYCFDGKVKYLYISEGMEEHKTAKISFLDPSWQFADFSRTDYVMHKNLPKKPSMYEKMITIAEKLSEKHPFLRVDLYEVDGQIYFSELTFTPCSGFMPFEPEEWDLKLGQMIDLSKVKK